MTEHEMIKEALSCLHASGDTIEEVMKMADRKRRNNNTGRTVAMIAIAACLIFVLAITAAAYNKGAFDTGDNIELSKFFSIAFGTGVEGQEAYDREFRDADGNLLKTEHYPNIERVEADPELAERLLGDYIVSINKGLQFNGYTLNIYSFMMDENGVGILYFELDNPDGIKLGKYASGVDESEPVPVIITLTDHSGNCYDIHCIAEEESFSDTHALYVAYLTPFRSFGGKALSLKVSWYGKENGSEVITLDCDKLIPSKQFISGGITATVSPIGMVTDTDISASVNNIVINYSNGSLYTVESDDTVNYVGSIIEDGGVAYAFYRLVDVDSIEGITMS